MTMLKDRWVLIVGGCGLFLLVALVLSGRTVAGGPADQQAANILRGHAAATHAALRQGETWVPADAEGDDGPWVMAIERINHALAARNLSAAVHEWRDAYAIARGSRRWQPMVEVGDAALRIGTATGFRRGYEGQANDAYLVAFFRARRLGSPDGVLRTADAFDTLGDHRMAQAVRGNLRAARRQPPSVRLLTRVTGKRRDFR